MNGGGVGFSWFKLTLVDETKYYVQLEGLLEEKQILVSQINGPLQRIGSLLEQQQIGKLEHTHIIGTLKTHQLVGTLGGERDE